jgi:uncharacterized protein (TIGR00299 family) protein
VEEIGERQPPRTWRDIQQLLIESRLDKTIRNKALAIFSLLAAAEAKIHRCAPAQVHFHEIGAVDSIIDIVGTAIGITSLGIDYLISSPLPMPRGWMDCAHGRLPLPAPAVCEILSGAEVYGTEVRHELVTPTGAAIIKALSRAYGQFPRMVIETVGYGAGSRKSAERPNLFRLVLGRAVDSSEWQQVEIVETNLDDWAPEGFPYLLERLFAAGALDASLMPIHMKKGRPGFLLQVIAAPLHSLTIKNIIFSETTAIGLRYRTEKRMTLPRRQGSVATPWGAVLVKKVETPDGQVLYPEYESCREIAERHGVSLKEVYRAVHRCKLEDFTEKEA